MTAAVFRRIVLGLDGASEGAHMGHPDFRANGRIFASLDADLKRANVRLTPDQQQAMMGESTAFEPAAGAWGRGGWTRITLSAVDEETLGHAVTMAWQLNATLKAPRSTANSAKPRKATPAKTRKAVRR
jgi:hypothetical protein